MAPRRIAGLLLLVVSLAVVPLSHVLTDAWLSAVTKESSAPDQGAMVTAYFFSRASVGLALGVALVGLCLLIWPASKA